MKIRNDTANILKFILIAKSLQDYCFAVIDHV